jgi:predicted Zn-dependent protease
VRFHASRRPNRLQQFLTGSLGQQELEALLRFALEEATQQGVDQAEVAASHDIGLTTTARLGDVENLEFTNDRGLGITVYKDCRKGNASTSDVSPPTCETSILIIPGRLTLQRQSN